MVIRSNELKHKIKMLSIHRAIFHNGVKQKVLVNVYTRTWWKIPDIKLLVRRLELRRTSYLWMNCATKTYWDFFSLTKIHPSTIIWVLLLRLLSIVKLVIWKSFYVWQLKTFLSTTTFGWKSFWKTLHVFNFFNRIHWM